MKTPLYFLSLYSVFIPLMVGVFVFKHLAKEAKIVLLIVLAATIPHIATIFQEDQPIAFYNGYIIVDALLWPLLFVVNLKPKTLKLAVIFLFSAHAFFLVFFFLTHLFSNRFYYELVCLNSLVQA